MKILILTVSAGYGHHAAAAALSSALEARGCDSQTLDLFKYIGEGPYKFVEKGYEAATKYIPKPYGMIFNRMSRRTADSHRTIDSRTVRLTSAKLLRYLQGYRPDIVVSTHIFGAMSMDELKRKRRTTVPTVGLLTDYEFHPYWEDIPEIEYIITGSDMLDVKAARRGINLSKLVPLGIPVAEKFLRRLPTDEARRRVGLDANRFTVLLMSGSMGYGDLTDVASALAAIDGIQLLCVCGRNEKARASLTELRLPNTKIYGFISDCDVMMDAADCIVTKPGGLTTTEALAKQLPIILFGPIPGQEERNTEFLCGMGVAIATSTNYTPDEAVRLLIRHPERAEAMRAAAARAIPTDSANRCADFIMSVPLK